MTEHPSAELDDVIHQRVRLGVLSILAQTREADFTYLRDTLGVTDGNLGRHLDVLNRGWVRRAEQDLRGTPPAHVGDDHAEGTTRTRSGTCAP